MTTAPSISPLAVDRPDLRRRLDDSLSAPLSVIIAPAGSGKTVLLTQWAASHPDRRFVWLGIEPADDDARHLTQQLLAGLRAVTGEPVEPGTPPAVGDNALGTPLLESLVTSMTDWPGLVLVFDDLHNLTNRSILSDLWWLADNLPPQVHMVFSSRSDIGIGSSRFRLRHAPIELRQADLAMDAGIAGAVLERIVGEPVSTGTLGTVMERTEGWAAGVQLTALTLRDSDDPERFARSLRGTDRLIADYLGEEVLAQQSPQRRDLLLRMSALERMSAPLVEAVLGVADAEAVLEDLERQSMFLVAVDSGREWFRFHHLFRDLLRYRLRSRLPDEEPRILRAAARWHLDHGDIESGVDALLGAHAWTDALEVILARGREVFERSQTVGMTRWLAAVPDDVRAAEPAAEILYGVVLGMSGGAVRGEDVLRRQAARPDVTPEQAVVIHAWLAARVQFRPETDVSLRAAVTALELLDTRPAVQPIHLLGLDDPSLLRTLALTSGGRAHFLAGDLPRAREWFDRARAQTGSQYSAFRVHLLGAAALLEAWSGRLGIAQSLAEEALELARDAALLAHAAPADAYLAAALVAIERGEPRAAALRIHEGAVRAASNRRTQLSWIMHLERLLAQPDEASGSDPVPPGPPPPIVATALHAASFRAQRLGGAPRLSTPDTTAWSPVLVEAVSSALAAHRPDLARAHLDAVPFAASDDHPRAAVENLILRSWLASSERRHSESQRAMTAALALASPHSLITVFVQAGPDVIALIASLPCSTGGFAKQVLDRARSLARPQAAYENLPEQLTDREREILVYLPTRMTNTELAGHCYVSVNTIKTHMAHIYRKLDAPNRNAAVARARELGLL